MSKKSYDRSDQELDDILRKISDSAEVPFSEEDWVDMKARLDKTAGPSPAWLLKGIGWGGALLLAGMISWLIISTPEKNQNVNHTENAYETSQKQLKTETETPERAKETQSTTLSPPITAQPLKAKGNENRSVNHSSGSSRDYQGLDNKQSVGKSSASDLHVNSDFLAPQFSPVIWQRNGTPPLDSLDLRPHQSAFQNRKITETDTAQEKLKEKRPYGFGGRFNLSIQAAPDLSGVKLNQVGKAGQAIGIGVEYFLRPRFSVASGAFYSFKPYTTEGGDLGGYGKQPDRVIGECDVFDIPLNLRFYPIEGKLQRVFASVGLSSYLMLKEHYKLEYQNTGTGYPYSREIEVNGANNHFFGVVNVSVGYERKLGNQVSIQVEPYFKVPINGVGEGDISLKSAGLFVGLKYYPRRRNIN